MNGFMRSRSLPGMRRPLLSEEHSLEFIRYLCASVRRSLYLDLSHCIGLGGDEAVLEGALTVAADASS